MQTEDRRVRIRQRTLGAVAACLLASFPTRAEEPGATAASPPETTEPARPSEPLSLSRAILEALQNNLQIEISRTQPLAAEQQVRAAQGAFDPEIYGEAGFDHDEVPTASQFQVLFGGGTSLETDVWDMTSGLRGRLPLGLQYSSAYSFRQTDSSSSFLSLLPQYDARWISQITLPLLRGLLDNQANITVKRSRIARDISEEAFRQSLQTLIGGVENAYWGLSSARAADRVAQKSLERAANLLEQTRIQFEVGVVSKLAVSQAQAGLADREFNAITARNRLERSEDELRDAIRAPRYSEFRGATLLTDEPEFVSYEVDERIAVEKALALRPEMHQAQQRLEEAALLVAQAENGRLPQLDLVGRYQLDGLSGRVKPPLDPTNPAQVLANQQLDDALGNNRSTAHDLFFRDSGAQSWGIGAQFSVPLGSRTASATLVQRRIELRRSRTDFARVRQDVLLDVRAAVRNLDSAVQGYLAAERRREAGEEALRAEEERLRLGDSTPFQVLEVEEDLVQAENQRIAALQVLQNSITAIEIAQGTLLEARGIQTEEELERAPAKTWDAP
jgi:outer membrane protein TolC